MTKRKRQKWLGAGIVPRGGYLPFTILSVTAHAERAKHMMLVLTFEEPPRDWDHLGKGQKLDEMCRREPEVEWMRMKMRMMERKKDRYNEREEEPLYTYFVSQSPKTPHSYGKDSYS